MYGLFHDVVDDDLNVQKTCLSVSQPNRDSDKKPSISPLKAVAVMFDYTKRNNFMICFQVLFVYFKQLENIIYYTKIVQPLASIRSCVPQVQRASS